MRIETFMNWVNDRWERDPRPDRDKLTIAALGIVGEAGEISEPIKKYLYSGKPISRSYMVKELGDLLHYWCRLCKVFGIDPNEIIYANIDKLKERLPEGYAPIPDPKGSFLVE